MRAIYTTLAILALCQVGFAQAGLLTLDYTKTLSSQLSTNNGNFNPQGLGYDTGSNELLFMQQASRTIYRTDLNGIITGSRDVGKNHTTSVAGDGTNYYFSDYTGNASSADLFSIDKNGAAPAAIISSEVAAYGGYPIDVRNNLLYRTQNTMSYSWAGLNQVRVSNINAVDSILQTISLLTAIGIGDIAVDSARNQIWTIDYTSLAVLRQFDLTTGIELGSFNLGLDGLTAGLTYANDTLYYYDWNNSGSSTLSAYSMVGFGGANNIPEPATLAFLGLGLVAIRFASKSKRAKL